jgi:lactoylglutathione lyase
MPARWTHVVLKVSDLDRSIEFYRRFCGLELVRDGRGGGGHTVWLGPAPSSPSSGDRLPPFVLVLYLHAVDARLDHLGFQCDAREEVDRIAADAARLGILVEPPFDGGGDIGYVTQIRDPDGHLVEFTHGQPLTGL